MTVKKAPTKAQKMGVKRAEKKTTMRTKRPQNDAKATPEAHKKKNALSAAGVFFFFTASGHFVLTLPLKIDF